MFFQKTFFISSIYNVLLPKPPRGLYPSPIPLSHIPLPESPSINMCSRPPRLQGSIYNP